MLGLHFPSSPSVHEASFSSQKNSTSTGANERLERDVAHHASLFVDLINLALLRISPGSSITTHCKENSDMFFLLLTDKKELYMADIQLAIGLLHTKISFEDCLSEFFLTRLHITHLKCPIKEFVLSEHASFALLALEDGSLYIASLPRAFSTRAQEESLFPIEIKTPDRSLKNNLHTARWSTHKESELCVLINSTIYRYDVTSYLMDEKSCGFYCMPTEIHAISRLELDPPTTSSAASLQFATFLYGPASLIFLLDANLALLYSVSLDSDASTLDLQGPYDLPAFATKALSQEPSICGVQVLPISPAGLLSISVLYSNYTLAVYTAASYRFLNGRPGLSESLPSFVVSYIGNLESFSASSSLDSLQSNLPNSKNTLLLNRLIHMNNSKNAAVGVLLPSYVVWIDLSDTFLLNTFTDGLLPVGGAFPLATPASCVSFLPLASLNATSACLITSPAPDSAAFKASLLDIAKKKYFQSTAPKSLFDQMHSQSTNENTHTSPKSPPADSNVQVIDIKAIEKQVIHHHIDLRFQPTKATEILYLSSLAEQLNLSILNITTQVKENQNFIHVHLNALRAKRETLVLQLKKASHRLGTCLNQKEIIQNQLNHQLQLSLKHHWAQQRLKQISPPCESEALIKIKHAMFLDILELKRMYQTKTDALEACKPYFKKILGLMSSLQNLENHLPTDVNIAYPAKSKLSSALDLEYLESQTKIARESLLQIENTLNSIIYDL